MLTFNEKTLAQLEAEPTTKGEVFAGFPHTYDCALPKGWLDAFADWCKVNPSFGVTYCLILGSTVWSYPATGQGQCGPAFLGNKRIGLIKRYRQEFNLGLRDAMQLANLTLTHLARN